MKTFLVVFTTISSISVALMHLGYDRLDEMEDYVCGLVVHYYG